MTSSPLSEEITAKIDELCERLSGLAENNPVRSFEKNVKAALACATQKLDLVSREEFEVQRDLLLKTLDRVAELEARAAALEADGQASS
jgi:BMFP domain-containing protein YqiC